MADDIAVVGSVELRPRVPFRDAVAYVRIRDVRVVDDAAPAVAERTIKGIAGRAGAELTVPFKLSFRPAPGGSYIVEAHVSLSGKQDIELGDYLTMESYPVATDRNKATIRIRARPVE